MNSITLKAHGKLNLYLDITGRRADGYHLLKSVMQSVSVYDTLTFERTEGEGTELVCADPYFPKDSSNLICKAAVRFFERAGVAPCGLRATVEKRIPSMAGMAGGSADCAAALIALNELFDRPLGRDELLELGAGLGADVPFTMIGGTVLCEGIGEKLTALPPLENLWFAVVRPEVRISTPEAYRAFDSLGDIERKSYGSFEAAVIARDAAGIADGIFNALEAAVSEPEIDRAKARLIEGGALGAMMTGSGSAVFGVFSDRAAAERCIERMKDYPFAQVLEPAAEGIETTGVI